MSRWTSASGWAGPGTTPRTEVTSPTDEDRRIPLVQPRTERLVLRQWRDEDWAPFAALNADPEVMRHFPWTLDEQESNAFAYRNAVRRGRVAVRALGLGSRVCDGGGAGRARRRVRPARAGRGRLVHGGRQHA